MPVISLAPADSPSYQNYILSDLFRSKLIKTNLTLIERRKMIMTKILIYEVSTIDI